MESQLEQKIRERAYELWVRDGCIPGRADDYWYQAELEVRSEADASSTQETESLAGGSLGEAQPSSDVAPSSPLEIAGGASGDASPVKTRKRRAPASPKPAESEASPAAAPKRRRSVQVP